MGFNSGFKGLMYSMFFVAHVRIYVNIHIDIVSDKLPHFTPFISPFQFM